jgi:hypothetical protein
MGASPGLSYGQVLTPAQWNALFASKVDDGPSGIFGQSNTWTGLQIFSSPVTLGVTGQTSGTLSFASQAGGAILVSINGAGTVLSISGNTTVNGTFGTPTPQTLGGSGGTVLSSSVIITTVSGSFTAFLPNPALTPGGWMVIKTTGATIVVSSTSNVVPLTGGAAGGPILPGGAGKWASMQSDGTNWVIMMAN